MNKLSLMVLKANQELADAIKEYDIDDALHMVVTHQEDMAWNAWKSRNPRDLERMEVDWQ